MSLQPRVVVVHRRSEYEELLARHGTRGQAAHVLESRGQDIADLEARHAARDEALRIVGLTIPGIWRRAHVERTDLDRFLFAPEDVVVVVGRDGLVANVAKYLDGQPVVGIDPDPGRNPGVLVPHAPEAAEELITASAYRPTVEERIMVAAIVDDGQRLCALNELYIGHASHQSARYRLELPGEVGEPQSSSGVLVGTGTGATGWLLSALRDRGCDMALPAPGEPRLGWFVREAWPSPVTGREFTHGLLEEGQRLGLVVDSDRLVCFGDGIEADSLVLTRGQRVEVGVAPRRLRLVVAA